MATEAISIDRLDPSFWLVRASAFENLSRFKEGIFDGKKTISISNGDDIYLQVAYNNLGYTYSKYGDNTNAEFYLRKAIELDEANPYAFNNLGLVMANKGDIKKGFDLINYSIQLNSSNSYAYKNRAKLYLIEGNIKKATIDLNKAKQLDYKLDYGNEVNDLLDKIKLNKL